ncbi:MAG: BRCT domain-containing protein [Sulfuricella sp.]
MSNEAAIAKALQQRALTKAAQSLLGICAGISADGHLADAEIAFLRTWLADNADAAAVWPGSALVRRIDEILADGVVTPDERASLLASLQQLSGNQFADTGASAPAAPAAPIDEDASIFFSNMTFCFTGNFHYGTRANCERAVLKLAAMPVDNVTGKLDYLVVGAIVAESWANGTYGRKIEAAMQRRERYGQPTIISESQWVKAMEDATR